MPKYESAPELEVSHWLNTSAPITLESLRGRVVLIEAFQMLCPGCVSHGLPQAVKARQLFSPSDLAVIGLHTVFEHHEAQGTEAALKAFLHEYKIAFPVAIDAPAGADSRHAGLPKTMERYRLRGTPSLILLDRLGRIRKHKFGMEEDMLLGAEIMKLIREEPHL